MAQTALKKSIMDGITIGMGYLPVAIAFGISAEPLMSLLDTVLMSLMIYGGASQFLVLQMLASSSALAIVIAVFVLNSRHFVMAFKVNYDLKHESFLKRLVLSSYVTDESFAVTANSTREQRTFLNYFATFIIAYLFWVVFSAVGYLAGEWMSDGWIVASGIALYALFIALLVPAVRVHYKYGIVAVFGMILHYILSIIPSFPSGIAIIAAILLAALLGLILERSEVYN
ncbi:AzlC family ABC transporter permease [Salinicoccus hispanicus]|uniref:Branched-chain amino acid ABC transporter permease n=1 Tax=Salinicoccus hispanicus TaxID=157225 RepID=A0A6N8U075_9STAP|nr:AzlC family ABC transporter permease [Salinicoccus hispanicus]MXQ51183.1 branched-chain amino acid ABC transporter permease [Salinicoccus hispanicus]